MSLDQGNSQFHAMPQTNQYGGVLYNKPNDFGVPKDEKWYFQYCQYVSSKYNFLIPQFGWNGDTSVSSTVNSQGSNLIVRWATNCLLNEQYVKAQQNDRLFGFMGTDEVNTPLPTKFIKDPTPYVIFKHILGNMRKSVSTLPNTVYANAITNEALKEKGLSINMAKMKIDHAEDFAEAQEAGIEFAPMGNQEFSSPEEVEEFAGTMQDSMASFFTSETKDFLYSQNWEEQCGKMAEYLIPSYFCRVELIPQGTEIKWNVFRPAQCIWDNTFDDELGRRQRFQGVVENWSVPDLLVKWTWTEAEKQELNSIAAEIPNKGNTIIQLNNMNGATDLVWWGTMSRVPTVAVVKARWMSYDEETGRETWYQGDLIGNKWVKNFKPCENLTINKDGTINTPFCDFIPEMTYGVNYSIVDKMREISGLITGINGKINFLIARAKGKVPVFMGSKFPTGTNQIQLLRDIAAGLVFIDDVDMDELQRLNKDKLVEVMDLQAAAQDITTFRNEVLYWENKLRELASIPLVSLGAQTEIIGAKVQQETVEQATYGLYPLYHGFMLYLNQILNVQAQMKKNLISTLEDKESMRFQVSPRQFKYFEVTKNDSLPDIQIYLSQADQLEEADKAYIRAWAEREASKPQTWLDGEVAIELLTFNTKTEMVNYLRYKRKAWEMKQAKQQQEAAAMQQQQAAEANQTQENIAEIQGENTLANTALKGKLDHKGKVIDSVLAEPTE